MSLTTPKNPSTFTRMRQVYWEAKQSFNKSLGQREDSCIISSDSELDIRLELLRAADNYFNTLMRILSDYWSSLQKLVDTQDNLGLALIEYGTKDSTAAGKVMCMSGKAISKSAQHHSLLKASLMNLYHEVETFQFKATADALQTVAKMEKVRRSYRSGLLWLKNESEDIDPDVTKKLKNFKKVQEHIKRLKVRFDGGKLETMQKIDLFLLSRSNLFSQSLIPYNKAFKKMSKQSLLLMESTLKNVPLCLSYNFVTLKHLNQYSRIMKTALQQQISSEQMAKCQNTKSKSITPKPTHSYSSDILIPRVSNNDLQKNEFTFGETNNQSNNETLLIDLREERKNNPTLTALTLENNYADTSSKYSDDLLLLNFENSKPTFFNEYSCGDFQEAFEPSSNLVSPASQKVPKKENEELQFWSLIQSLEQTSKLRERDNPQGNAPVLAPKVQSSATATDSKWNDILVQFDPFMDENSKCNKAKNLEIC